MFKMKKGCEVPFPERITEEFEVSERKILANIDVEKVGAIMKDFIDMHDEPLFLILEIPTNAFHEPKNENGKADCLHKDVYYLDGCSQDEAKKILSNYGELLINDGLCTFGFGGHYSNDEMLFGKYNVMTVFCKNFDAAIALFEKYGIKQTELLVTAWETFSQDNGGVSNKVTIDGVDIYAVVEKLKEKGLYFADRREN